MFQRLEKVIMKVGEVVMKVKEVVLDTMEVVSFGRWLQELWKILWRLL